MNTDPHDRESQWQQQALGAAMDGESSATAVYRRIYAGVRWAPLPALAPDFASRTLARIGVIEEDVGAVERRIVPMLFATLGVGGGITAGPQLLGALGQVAFDFAGLPWLQAAAAVTAIAVAATIDRMFSRRRVPAHR
jgi:hypothetical protein